MVITLILDKSAPLGSVHTNVFSKVSFIVSFSPVHTKTTRTSVRLCACRCSSLDLDWNRCRVTLFSSSLSKASFSPVDTKDKAFSKVSAIEIVFDNLRFHRRFRSFQCGLKRYQEVCVFKRKHISDDVALEKWAAHENNPQYF